MTWSAGLATVASVVFLARLMPQPLRTLRTGHVAGVSAVAAMNSLVADAAWLLYGVTGRVLAVTIVSVPALLASGWTCFLLRRTVRRSDARLSLFWLASVAVCGWAGVMTVVLSLTVVVCCGPAVWSAFRSRHPVGLSRWTWWLAVADAASWGSYGTLIGDRPLEMYGLVMSATAVAMLLRLRATRCVHPDLVCLRA
jgi:uncharacterized protein with PQ loop repeat